MSYAEKTAVPVDRSQAEIRKILTKYGAKNFAYAEQPFLAVVIFEIKDRRVRFSIPMPASPDSVEARGQEKLYAQKHRSRWRSIALAIKAKLECVEAGIASFEEEFLAHIVLPNGNTAGGVMLPQIASAYKTGKMPNLLGFGG